MSPLTLLVVQESGWMMLITSLTAFVILSGFESAEATEGDTWTDLNLAANNKMAWAMTGFYTCGVMLYIPHLVRESADPGLQWLLVFLAFVIAGGLVAGLGTVAVCFTLVRIRSLWQKYRRTQQN